MALVSSLFTAISGLRNHQTLLDVISNNVSNVNTVGFKAGRVQFRDMLSQTISSAQGANPMNNMGGINPMQSGTGVTVASIDTVQTQGALQATGIATDMAINGDGFFVVKSGSETTYTRAGAFRFDSAGQLVDSSGALVQGWSAQTDPTDPLGPLVVDSTRTSDIGNITLNAGTTLKPQETRVASMVGNLDAGATAANCASSYGMEGTTQIRSWTYNTATASWVANDYVVGQHELTFSVYDSLGNAHNMTMTLTNLSGTRINGAVYNSAAVPPEENVYQDNTWAWEVSTDASDSTVHLALDNSWYYDPTDPTGQEIVRSSSSGLINFTTSGGVNWVAYADRNAQRFGTSSTGAANDPTIPGGHDNDDPANQQLPPVGFVPPGPGEGVTTDRWADIADADTANNSVIGFEGAIVPGQNLLLANPNYDVNNPNPALPNPDEWDNPSFQLRGSTGAFLFANQCEDLTKLPFVLVYQNVPMNSATPPTTVSAGSLVNLQVGNNNLPVVVGSNPTATTMEKWYVQAVDFDWGSVSTITKADFDRASASGAPPAMSRAAENDTFNDGALAADYNTGFSFPWDPYVTSDNLGARDGLTQDATGEWILWNGVNAYKPVFTAHGTADGYTEGTLQSVSVDNTGTVIGGFSNGIQQEMAQLAMASFENPGGLAKVGETHFTPTANSGDAVLGTALTGGRGSVVGGVLEQSNVDLSKELTDMIVAQRGFEVNARLITTSDRILDTLVNLGR
jgi:flagellar hook-basal body protein